MKHIQAALIDIDDFFTYGYPLTGSGGRIPHHPLTSWGVREDIAQQVLNGKGKSAVGTVETLAKNVVDFVLTVPSLTVIHVNTGLKTTAKEFPHLTATHVGKDEAPLLSNCHEGVPGAKYTLHFEDTVARDSTYINRGTGLPGVDDAMTFFPQSLTFPDKPGTFDWFPDRYFRKELLFFGPDTCVEGVQHALAQHGFSFADQPQGWDRAREQDYQIGAALEMNGGVWPVSPQPHI